MVTLVNRAKMSTSTTGTGAITLGSAESGYQSFADAGVSDGDVVRYVIEDGSDWEIGSGTYTATGTTLSRTVDESSNSDAALNLTGSAVVFITAAAEDVFQGELFAENYDGTSTLPSATGANAVAIGTGVGGPANASGFNAIALGVDAQSTGGASVAMAYSTASASYSFAAGGGNSQTYGASGANSAAIGTSSNARGSGSVALGKSAYVDTLGTQAVALGDSYASGSHSLAAAISTNSSSYGATGANSVAIGSQAKATGTYNVAIGREALADGAANAFAFGRRADAGGAGSLALGLDSDASGVNSIAIGQSYASGTDSLSAGIGSESPLYGAQHDNAVALGYQAITTAAKQIALGSSTAQVKVSGAYTLPTSDGTNGQVLTTDGSGAVTFADAGGGGADLYAAETTGSTDPTASGTRSIAIGSSASSTGTQSIAIGESATASGLYSVSIGSGTTDNTNDFSVAVGYFSRSSGEDATALGRSSKADGSRSTALGYNADANGSYSLAVGKGSLGYGSYSISIGADTQANYNYSTALGHNSSGQSSRADAAGSIALNGSRTGGTDSLAAAIANNTSSYGATGANSVAIGYQAKATNTYGVALGKGAQATGNRGYAIGNDSTASATKSGVFGGDGNTASGGRSVAIGGYYANARENNKVVFGGGYLGVGAGTNLNQSGILPLGAVTTDATATVMRSDNLTAGTTNQVILPNNSAYSFSGTIIARESATDGSDYASWEIKGALLRDANAASTVLGNGIKNKLYASAGASAWDIALTADTTNGGLKIEVTGAASTNIRWVATVNTSEVTYA